MNFARDTETMFSENNLKRDHREVCRMGVWVKILGLLILTYKTITDSYDFLSWYESVGGARR